MRFQAQLDLGGLLGSHSNHPLESLLNLYQLDEDTNLPEPGFYGELAMSAWVEGNAILLPGGRTTSIQTCYILILRSNPNTNLNLKPYPNLNPNPIQHQASVDVHDTVVSSCIGWKCIVLLRGLHQPPNPSSAAKALNLQVAHV